MTGALAACPVCAGDLVTTELACEACGTQIRGRFGRCHFCHLSQEQLAFLDHFLRNRGNLSGVGADLGISHPTVAKRLDSLLSALYARKHEAETGGDHREQERSEIIELLDQGEISADEATKRLKDLI